MRSLTKVAVLGVAGVVLFKLLAMLVLPLFGLMIGLMAMTVKLAVVVGIGFLVYALLRRPKRDERAGTVT